MSIDTHRSGSIYISGPMTGMPELNSPAFNAACEQLQSDWHTVFNPASNGVVEGAEWADYLRHDVRLVCISSAIYMLPGWSRSKGAQLELHVAKALGLLILFDPAAELQPPAEDANCKASKCCPGELLVPMHSTDSKLCTGCKTERPWTLEPGQKRTFN